jgi:hypothetical protein
MRRLVAGLVLATMTAACSTNGGMYSASDPANNEFSGWKTAGAVVLGVLTLGAIGAGAYAGASQPTYTPTSTYTTYNGTRVRTYIINGEYVTCYSSGSYVNCY